jgi:hypothetical protein
MFSCFREKPGPDVAVIAFTPATDAPMHAAMPAISSSIWMNLPPTCGSRSAHLSAISVDGVIGYPEKNRIPAAIAPSTTASLPCKSARFGAAFDFSN